MTKTKPATAPVFVTVASAVPLTPAELATLADLLSRQLGSITLKPIVKPQLVAGLTLTVTDRTLDLSIKHRLELLQHQLAPHAQS
ncbi:hypothetical protein A2W24_02100 [Microgenomates group bacterium RBG_16_45_19]|nr:MAG: hypothetical protein A2W24_02100 [Microgenomates group bacterium RBG_16_45_19]